MMGNNVLFSIWFSLSAICGHIFENVSFGSNLCSSWPLTFDRSAEKLIFTIIFSKFGSCVELFCTFTQTGWKQNPQYLLLSVLAPRVNNDYLYLRSTYQNQRLKSSSLWLMNISELISWSCMFYTRRSKASLCVSESLWWDHGGQLSDSDLQQWC